MSVQTSSVKRLTSTFTRPANTTAYTSGDLAANDTTAINVVPMSLGCGRGGLRINMVRLEKTATSVTNATFRVHFFESNPTVANGDNGVFSINLSDYIGFVDLPTMTAATNGAYATRMSSEASGFQSGTASGLYGYASSTFIYALVEVRGAYTPASGEAFTLSVTCEKF